MIDRNDTIYYLMIVLEVQGTKVTLPDGETIHKKGKNLISNISENIDEDYIINKINNFTYWKTEEGLIYEINSMSTSHLKNTINHINRKLDITQIDGKYENDLTRTKNSMVTLLRDRTINDILLEDDMGIDS